MLSPTYSNKHMLFCSKFMQEASLERSKDHEKHRLAHRWVQAAQAMTSAPRIWCHWQSSEASWISCSFILRWFTTAVPNLPTCQLSSMHCCGWLSDALRCPLWFSPWAERSCGSAAALAELVASSVASRELRRWADNTRHTAAHAARDVFRSAENVTSLPDKHQLLKDLGFFLIPFSRES